MPEGYTGLNFGSYTLAELTGVYFPQVTQSYFTSIAIEDIWEPVQPIETIYSPVEAITPAYTSVDAVETSYTAVI
tara:strand:+ start:12087 stop:12311 length:225 start_codon:yes stop_codon:yes gene_type:complete